MLNDPLARFPPWTRIMLLAAQGLGSSTDAETSATLQRILHLADEQARPPGQQDPAPGSAP